VEGNVDFCLFFLCGILEGGLERERGRSVNL